MIRKIFQSLPVAVLAGSLLFAMTGCVSVSEYDRAKKDAALAKAEIKEVKVLFAQERMKVLDLEKRNGELKQQTDKWETNLRATLDRLETLAHDWGQVRDNLMRQNMNRELDRMRAKNPSAKGIIILEPERESAPAKVTAKKGTKRVVAPTDDEKKLDKVLEEFRRLLKKN